MSTNFKIVLYTFITALLLGPSFLFMKVAVVEIPPLTMLSFRTVVASLCFYFYLRVEKVTIPRDAKTWLHLFAIGLLGSVFPFTAMTWGTSYIDSSLAGIVTGGVTPITTAILAHFILTDDRLSYSRFIGVSASLIGFLVIFIPRIDDGVSHNAFGIMLVTIGAMFYGAGPLYARIYLKDQSPLLLPFGQLFTASLIFIPAATLLDYPYTMMDLFRSSPQALGSTVGITLMGTFLAFVFYYKTFFLGGPTKAAMALYITPAVAILLGITILGEEIFFWTWVGFALIISGVLIVNEVIRVRRPDVDSTQNTGTQ